MRIVVRTFAYLREAMGGEKELEIPEGYTLGELLSLLFKEEHARSALLGEDGLLHQHISIMVGRRRVRMPQALSLHLADGDEVALLPPLSGG